MDILQSIADNAALLEAVRKVIEDEFALDDIDTRTMPNSLIGEMVRARLEGLRKINDAFKEILTHKSRPKIIESKNPAR